MRTLTLVQEMYFDVVDVINGQSYKSLGYDSQSDFLDMLKEKLQEVVDEFNRKVEEIRVSKEKEIMTV